MNCPTCNADLPTAVERAYVRVSNPDDTHAGSTGVLSDITYIVPHPFALNALLSRCPGSAHIVNSVPVE